MVARLCCENSELLLCISWTTTHLSLSQRHTTNSYYPRTLLLKQTRTIATIDKNLFPGYIQHAFRRPRPHYILNNRKIGIPTGSSISPVSCVKTVQYMRELSRNRTTRICGPSIGLWLISSTYLYVKGIRWFTLNGMFCANCTHCCYYRKAPTRETVVQLHKKFQRLRFYQIQWVLCSES